MIHTFRIFPAALLRGRVIALFTSEFRVSAFHTNHNSNNISLFLPDSFIYGSFEIMLIFWSFLSHYPNEIIRFLNYTLVIYSIDFPNQLETFMLNIFKACDLNFNCSLFSHLPTPSP